MENPISINLPWSTLITLLFYVLVFAYTLFTIIFIYHWQNYSVSVEATTQTYIAYFIISLPLIGLMGLALLAI